MTRNEYISSVSALLTNCKKVHVAIRNGDVFKDELLEHKDYRPLVLHTYRMRHYNKARTKWMDYTIRTTNDEFWDVNMDTIEEHSLAELF